MKDYAELADRLQKGLGKAWRASASVLGRPGTSIAVKLDPNYYLVVMPSFINHMARWGGMLPRTAEDALRRTGNLLTGGPERASSLLASVAFDEPRRTLRIRAGFVLAGFMDDAVKLYGGSPSALPVADVALVETEREALEAFFGDKTMPAASAFTTAPA